MKFNNNNIKYLCILIYVFNLFDWVLTKLLLGKDVSGESNVLYTFMVNYNLDILFKFVIMGLVAFLLYKLSFKKDYYKSVLYGLAFLFIFYLFIIINNFYVLLFWSF